MNAFYFRRAVRITMPVFFGYVAIGIPFGLMMSSAGYPVWLTLLMSLFMYTGTGQYIAVGLFSAGARLPAIMVTMLLVSIRHAVYGLSLFERFAGTGRWKPYLIFALTDETYALLTSTELPPHTEPGPFYALVSALNQSYWTAGSAIGAAAGSLVRGGLEGVDFALTALFAIILCDQLRSSKDIVPPLIGIAVTAATIAASRAGIVPEQNILLTALAFGLAALSLCRHGTAQPEADA